MWPEREAKPATWSVTSDKDVAGEGGKTSNLECHLRRVHKTEVSQFYEISLYRLSISFVVFQKFVIE